jgi:hypothetical protein
MEQYLRNQEMRITTNNMNVDISSTLIYRLNKWKKKWPLFSKNSALFNIFNTEMWECGEAKETINYILWQCKLFEEFRVKMADDLMKRKIIPLYCIEAVLHFMLPEAVSPVARYINSVNIRIWIRLYHDNPNQRSIYA